MAALNEDQILCKILSKKLQVEGKENSCLEIVKKFEEHKDYEKTIEELSKMMGKTKEEIIDTISRSCVPCETSNLQ